MLFDIRDWTIFGIGVGMCMKYMVSNQTAARMCPQVARHCESSGEWIAMDREQFCACMQLFGINPGDTGILKDSDYSGPSVYFHAVYADGATHVHVTPIGGDRLPIVSKSIKPINTMEHMMSVVAQEPDDDLGKWIKAMAAQLKHTIDVAGCSSCQKNRARRKLEYYWEEYKKQRQEQKESLASNIVT